MKFGCVYFKILVNFMLTMPESLVWLLVLQNESYLVTHNQFLMVIIPVFPVGSLLLASKIIPTDPLLMHL